MNTTEMAIAAFSPNAAKYAAELESAMLKGGILSQIEKAHFMAQMAVESADFSKLEENLNYSSTRLRQVFNKYFPTDAKALEYAHRPEAIGNRVYANRYGNGNEASGDGYKYRGRGFTQLTFHDNYRDASQSIFKSSILLVNPGLAAMPETAAKIAVWYWNSRSCCGPARNDDIVGVTQKINGGQNGIADRKLYLIRAKKVFNIT